MSAAAPIGFFAGLGAGGLRPPYSAVRLLR